MKFIWMAGLLMPTLAVAAPMIDCPDCGGSVSSRAVMCPHCGAPAEAIAEAVAALEAEKEEAPKEPDNVLVAKVNGRECYALPVAMKDGAFAVLPADALIGLETLELFFASTNLPVAYGTPSVAQGAPLVRLPLSETNLTFHAIAENARESFVFDIASLPPASPQPVAAVRECGRAVGASLPDAPGRDVSTKRPPVDIPLSDKLLWHDVSPRELKNMFNPKKKDTP